ncbi:MAG: hypothetical protein JKY49_17570 [Cohaesibacteraceae bacterium]|nr:hypothetical protein [Cohaesibacteraceae bacterium]
MTSDLNIDKNTDGSCGCTTSCDLPVAKEQQVRDDFLQNLMPLVKRMDLLDNGRAFEFDDTPAMRKRLDDLVARERKCCGHLGWGLNRVEATDRIRLEVTGLSPQSPMFNRIAGGGIATMKMDQSDRSGNSARIGKSAGIGIMSAMVLCCVVPIVVAVVAGAAVAAPLFAFVENPITILAITTLAGFGAWFYMKRQKARNGDSCGCNKG